MRHLSSHAGPVTCNVRLRRPNVPSAIEDADDLTFRQNAAIIVTTLAVAIWGEGIVQAVIVGDVRGTAIVLDAVLELGLDRMGVVDGAHPCRSVTAPCGGGHE